LAAGANNNAAHWKFMIGSPELKIDGETADGQRTPLIRNSAWMLPWRVRAMTDLTYMQTGGNKWLLASPRVRKNHMRKITLSAGTIRYEDTGGGGPIIVLLHGLVMDGSVWRHVVQHLRNGHRCVVPTMPLGSHLRPMRANADLSPHGIARLQAEFLEALDLREVTLVGNDSGLFQITAGWYPERIARLVLTPCEAFENFPPGLPGRVADVSIRLPGGPFLMAQLLRIHALRRLPLTFGWMSKRPVPNDVFDGWLRPAQRLPGVRRDLRRYVRALDKKDLLVAAERLRGFDRPALVVWAPEDRIMPPEHGRRLTQLLPHARLVEIPDSYTLVPEDQPERLALAIRQFIRDTS
jgi:pimeloyl-ACP methyl ester carboxylesterase